MYEWAFCSVEDVTARLRDEVEPTGDQVDDLQRFIYERAAVIRLRLQTRGIFIADESWQHEYPDIWSVCVTANATGATLDFLSVISEGSSEYIPTLQRAWNDMLDDLDSADLRPVPDASARKGSISRTFQTDNPTHASATPMIDVDTEY